MCPHSLQAGASPIMSPRTSCTVATEFSALATGAVSGLATGAVSGLATGAVSVLASGTIVTKNVENFEIIKSNK